MPAFANAVANLEALDASTNLDDAADELVAGHAAGTRTRTALVYAPRNDYPRVPREGDAGIGGINSHAIGDRERASLNITSPNKMAPDLWHFAGRELTSTATMTWSALIDDGSVRSSCDPNRAFMYTQRVRTLAITDLDQFAFLFHHPSVVLLAAFDLFDLRLELGHESSASAITKGRRQQTDKKAHS